MPVSLKHLVTSSGKRIMHGNNVVSAYPNRVISFTLGGIGYSAVLIGDQYWMTANLRNIVSEETYWDQEYSNEYGAYYGAQDISANIDALVRSEGLAGFHVPTEDDMDALIGYVMSDTGDPETMLCKYLYAEDAINANTVDRYGMHVVPSGACDMRSDEPFLVNLGAYGNANLGYIGEDPESVYRIYLANEGTYDFGMGSVENNYKVSVRLVYNV